MPIYSFKFSRNQNMKRSPFLFTPGKIQFSSKRSRETHPQHSGLPNKCVPYIKFFKKQKQKQMVDADALP